MVGGKGELDTMRAFLGGMRQVSNATHGFTTRKNELEAPKLQAAFNYLNEQVSKDPSYKAVIYSNYLNSGLNPYKQYLEQNQIPYGEFSGNISSAVRNKLVQDYNKNKLKALLISSAGAEGLDLKGTRLVQILEPHFNEEKEKQIIGRGARYLSHAGLPPDKQNVLVQRYLAQPKAGFLDRILGHPDVKGADEYIRQMAMQKDVLNREVMALMDQEKQKNRGVWPNVIT
jgi:superfamily II DNA/RNA helicase